MELKRILSSSLKKIPSNNSVKRLDPVNINRDERQGSKS